MIHIYTTGPALIHWLKEEFGVKSNAALARILELPPQTVRQWAKGVREPKLGKILPALEKKGIKAEILLKKC